ncbi:DUF317 domain-containing protein [Streptomyces phyllanthi]|nr:DUF317 domain-containing protein [Streptomyces phyllanthi]
MDRSPDSPSFGESGGEHAPRPVRYRVSPRYLAGNDGELAEQVRRTLIGNQWTCWTTRHQELHLFDAEQLRLAEHLPLTPQLLLDDDPVVWQFSARVHREALPSWNTYFTANTPHELVTAFATALATEPDVTTPTGCYEARSALGPLSRAGWAPDPTDPARTYYAPQLLACVTFRRLPPEIEDSNPLPSAPGWLAWAEPPDGALRQWAAAFSPSTPASLVTRFCSALADPTPVCRVRLPPGTSEHLTVSL